MSKKLQIELDEFTEEEEIGAVIELVYSEMDSPLKYKEEDMIIFDFCNDDYLGEYPGVQEDVEENKSAFGIHPSVKLQELYKLKYWQGQSPEKAKVIFLGLDANWDKEIERNEAYYHILQYLIDGVLFWQEYGVHHPFLLSEYRNKGGYKYHKGFSKLGISKEHAEEISFVELINKPTFGISTKEKNEYMSLIDEDYLKKLNDIVFDNRKKIVFLSKTLYDDILRIKKKMKNVDIFNFGLPMGKNIKCMNRLLNIHNIGETFIFVCTHFSASIKNEHINDMGVLINSFLNDEEKIWWRVSYVGSWNGELVHEDRYIFEKDIFKVKAVLYKHLNQLRIERDFSELELKPVKEEMVERHLIWD